MKGTEINIYPILVMSYSPILGTTYELRNVAEVIKNEIPELEDSLRHLRGGKDMAYEASTTITFRKGSSYTENELGENPNGKA
jgi:hypothetical protein